MIYNWVGKFSFHSSSKQKWKSLSRVWLFETIVHVILQARKLEWVASPLSRGSSQPRGGIQVSCTAGRWVFNNWAIREAQFQRRAMPKCSNYCTITFISQASKFMLNILQTRLQQYVNWKIPDVWVGFWRGREPEINVPAFIHFSLVTQSCWTLRPHELQHARLPFHY